MNELTIGRLAKQAGVGVEAMAPARTEEDELTSIDWISGIGGGGAAVVLHSPGRVLVCGVAYGVTRMSKAQCCCDFSDGKILCGITGQELSRCCCE